MRLSQSEELGVDKAEEYGGSSECGSLDVHSIDEEILGVRSLHSEEGGGDGDGDAKSDVSWVDTGKDDDDEENEVEGGGDGDGDSDTRSNICNTSTASPEAKRPSATSARFQPTIIDTDADADPESTEPAHVEGVAQKPNQGSDAASQELKRLIQEDIRSFKRYAESKPCISARYEDGTGLRPLQTIGLGNERSYESQEHGAFAEIKRLAPMGVCNMLEDCLRSSASGHGCCVQQGVQEEEEKVGCAAGTQFRNQYSSSVVAAYASAGFRTALNSFGQQVVPPYDYHRAACLADDRDAFSRETTPWFPKREDGAAPSREAVGLMSTGSFFEDDYHGDADGESAQDALIFGAEALHRGAEELRCGWRNLVYEDAVLASRIQAVEQKEHALSMKEALLHTLEFQLTQWQEKAEAVQRRQKEVADLMGRTAHELTRKTADLARPSIGTQTESLNRPEASQKQEMAMLVAIPVRRVPGAARVYRADTEGGRDPTWVGHFLPYDSEVEMQNPRTLNQPAKWTDSFGARIEEAKARRLNASMVPKPFQTMETAKVRTRIFEDISFDLFTNDSDEEDAWTGYCRKTWSDGETDGEEFDDASDGDEGYMGDSENEHFDTDDEGLVCRNIELATAGIADITRAMVRQLNPWRAGFHEALEAIVVVILLLIGFGSVVFRIGQLFRLTALGW